MKSAMKKRKGDPQDDVQLEKNAKGGQGRKKGRWDVGKAKQDEPEIDQPQGAGIIPKVPFRWILSGPSKSGKTNLARWALDKFYSKSKNKSYFDEIHLFSPTANIDYTWSKLPGLENKNRHTKPTKQMILKELQKAKKGILGTTSDSVPPLSEKQLHSRKQKAKKILFIFDDAIAESKLINSDEFLTVFIEGRHFMISSMIMTQAYKKVPRSARIQATHLSMFPSMTSEIERVGDDFGPKELSKKEFLQMVTEATEPDEACPFPFLHVDRFAPIEKRFRRNLTETIQMPSCGTRQGTDDSLYDQDDNDDGAGVRDQ